MLRNLVILAAVLALALPCPAALLKGDGTQITVSGRGEVKARPDVAYVTIGVERTEKTAAEAQGIVARKMTAIQASLKKLGIKENKIETTQVSLYPAYQYDKGKRTLIGYTARNQIRVTVDKLADTGKVIDTAVSAGATNIQSIAFSLKDESSFRNAALKKAFEEAKGKAESIAAAAGLSIKRILRVQEAGARVIPPVSSMRAMAAEAAAPTTPVSPGDVEVHGSLTVVYECRAK